LDPHVTQAHADTTVIRDDSSYHCDKVNRMKFTGLDPSLALVRKWMFIVLFDFVLFKAFACKTESEFDDLIMKLRQVKNDLFLMEIFIIFS
jgi:hypothetical protein